MLIKKYLFIMAAVSLVLISCKKQEPGENQHNTQYFEFNRVKDMFGGKKIITLSECGSVPDPSQMKTYGDMWSWFMPWNGDYTRSSSHNGSAWWNTFFSYSYVITRDKMPNLH